MKVRSLLMMAMAALLAGSLSAVAPAGPAFGKALKPSHVQKVDRAKLRQACQKNQHCDAAAGRCVDAGSLESDTPIPIPATPIPIPGPQ